ncbi:response regulator transcription factor [Sulfuriflexus sp.]|uniref:response regulator transcription factor n=1 Tax=Sulfuriflexus sp. TaxID=2015443 RepID=UPI0028CE3D54|nr:response regulator transcription factor [Sulfuriflexus sp.]MDT8404503.1 response regulator transcription factor [Sulfuriflexus sp.]
MIILCSTDEKVLARWQQGLDVSEKYIVCTDQVDLNASINRHQDSLVLLQLNFPDLINADDVAKLVLAQPSIRVIVCADVPDDEQGLALLKAGVYGYCNTWVASAQLGRIIEQVKAGEVWVGRNLILRLINDLSAATQAESPMGHECLKALTQREYEVAKLIGEGNSNKRIANELDITERTVKAHLSTIFRKTDCKDRIQLALLVNQTTSTPISKLGA